MKPEQALKYIQTAMSLRKPQIKSLSIFALYLQSEAGQKVLNRLKKPRENIIPLLESTKAYFRTIPEAKEFESFERSFPTFTFALATGVGKTRLMGAFAAYLHLVYGIKHFLIVAPGLTIYRKLVDDFKKANNPKYVFKGIQEINSSTANVITTEDYAKNIGSSLFQKLEINIFNVQQFAQKDIEKERGITKFQEVDGESYFDYLKNKNDLVVFLDEAHHYHADAALSALDRMDPLFGLEFTATPYVTTKQKSKKIVSYKMKNILYNYNLGDAIRDKYVKDPWIGTEADVDFTKFDKDSIDTDKRKLQLGIYFHERAKNALEVYSSENKKQPIKPVILIVASNIDHAKKLFNLINNDDFRGGLYKGKVIQVHTKIKGEEEDETIEKLISLEKPDNIVEIVIHVNMLKEGWDVANIYTIVPLRQSASEILTEQTIGRGLRLPYGEKTGVALVDRVMITAHENYANIIQLAKDSNLIQGNVEQVTENQTKEIKILTEIPSVSIQRTTELIQNSQPIMSGIHKHVEELVFKSTDVPQEVKQKAIEIKEKEIIRQLSQTINSQYSSQFLDESNQKINDNFSSDSLFSFLSTKAKEDLKKIKKTADNKKDINYIPIPRITLTPVFEELIIYQFELDTSQLSRYSTYATIIEESLQKRDDINLFGESVIGKRDSETTKILSFGQFKSQTPQNSIISGLQELPLVDYNDKKQRGILMKLANEAINYYSKYALDENNLKYIIENNFRQIATEIYNQILKHVEFKSQNYEESTIIGEPKPQPELPNIGKGLYEKEVSLESQVNTFSAELFYSFFHKACHIAYRFQSSDEARFAYLLEKDKSVEDWMKPARKQFEGLHWRDEKGDSNHEYEPDFVIEFHDEIVIVEVKSEKEVETFDVQAKKKTAEKYCELVTKNIGKFGITKPWRYVLLSTEKISISSTIGNLLNK